MQELTQTLNKLTVLFADDDENFRKEMVQILKLFFKDVIEAKDGLEALELFEMHTVHVAFLDYCMPKLNGYEVASKIRLSQKEFPIVFMSGFSDEEKLFNAIKIKVEGYVKKPFNQMDILQIMSSITRALMSTHNHLKIQIAEDVWYDFTSKTIHQKNDVLILTKSEVDLVELLIQNKSRLVPTELIEEVIFNGHVEANTLRNLIYRLRKKIGVPLISNVKDLGYILA